MDMIRTSVWGYLSARGTGSGPDSDSHAGGAGAADIEQSLDSFEMVDVSGVAAAAGSHAAPAAARGRRQDAAKSVDSHATDTEALYDEDNWVLTSDFEAEAENERKESVFRARQERVWQREKDTADAKALLDRLGEAILWYRGDQPASGNRGILDESRPLNSLSEEDDMLILVMQPEHGDHLGLETGDRVILWNVQSEDKSLCRALNGEHTVTVISDVAFRLDDVRLSSQITADVLADAMVLRDPITWEDDGTCLTYALACKGGNVLTAFQESSLVSYTAPYLEFLRRQGWEAAASLVKEVSERSSTASSVCHELERLSECKFASSMADALPSLATLKEAAYPSHWKSPSTAEACANCAKFFRSSDDPSSKANCHDCGEVICGDCYSNIKLPWRGFVDPVPICAVCSPSVLVRNEVHSKKEILVTYISTGLPRGPSLGPWAAFPEDEDTEEQYTQHPEVWNSGSSDKKKKDLSTWSLGLHEDKKDPNTWSQGFPEEKEVSLFAPPLAACEAPSASTPTTVQEFMLSPRATSTVEAAEDTPQSPPKTPTQHSAPKLPAGDGNSSSSPSSARKQASQDEGDLSTSARPVAAEDASPPCQAEMSPSSSPPTASDPAETKDATYSPSHSVPNSTLSTAVPEQGHEAPPNLASDKLDGEEGEENWALY
mmetsp:Transcript_89819/g.187747  ORF Transcript_89819/g.187747 Transcript_89819/m.187747 type:complete len:663 (-) Transcript_89819:234-2222(-)|eukprot:CAMPEP_0206458422 /NCGR_PEP_ID=MMETSP0324_2-20121206/23559_1 /ASSEMBLY_ACC=CAM_ASM_000836 /TAXON_ID=2866 /ORGANISM="Crypthecodinium cohnii, Strain Seligo" /LENGTH=662 /DNA_ID=CAMNT_0053929755 /DNA_START=73 /DNA_END=2061 /DNA_ORIENTATION=-